MRYDGIKIVRIPRSHYEVRGNGQVWVIYCEVRDYWVVYNQADLTQSYRGVHGYRAAVNLALARIRGEEGGRKGSMSHDGADEEISFTVGSGNVFADLGLPNPEEHQLKARLAHGIERAMDEQHLSLSAAAHRIGTTPAALRQIRRGRLACFSVPLLTGYLEALAS